MAVIVIDSPAGLSWTRYFVTNADQPIVVRSSSGLAPNVTVTSMGPSSSVALPFSSGPHTRSRAPSEKLSLMVAHTKKQTRILMPAETRTYASTS